MATTIFDSAAVTGARSDPGPRRDVGPLFEVRMGRHRLDHAVYLRRRLLAGLMLFALATAIGLSSHLILADRGGVPASTPAIPPATALIQDPQLARDPVGQLPRGGAAATPARSTASSQRPTATYVVQPGDSLWSIAERLSGVVAVPDYVDRLVSANGGASILAGQLLHLP